ncbi:MAG: hypothetical protein ACRDGI_08035 [Candidatus Limnocylindrales bacterium]
MERRGRRPGPDARPKGNSYPQGAYEDAIGALLAEIGAVDDPTITEVVHLHDGYRPHADELALARITRERDEASRHLAETRDVVAWQAAMTQLDAAESVAREPLSEPRLSPPEIVDYLRSLPRLWAETGPDGRQAPATALFAKTDVLGFERLEYELTPDAIELGLDAALPAVMELGCGRVKTWEWSGREDLAR